MPTDRPIFLIGCPRSGTTLLSAMLHAHPRLAMPPETRFLIPAYEHRVEFGDLRVAANRRQLAEWITRPTGTKFADLRLDRATVVEKIVAGPPTFGSAAGIVWQEYAASRGKARWGEKRPAYWRYLGMVLRLFPDAQVIHLIRDGRSCVASLERMPWWTRGRLAAMTTWALADRELHRLGRRLPSDAYYALRYEDVVADPAGELTALCAYLGEEFDDRMLAYGRAARDVVPTAKPWFARVGQAPDEKRIMAWRDAFDDASLGLLERAFGRALRANGYELTGAAARASTLEVRRYRHAYVRARASLHRWQLQDARRRRRDVNPLAARLPSGEVGT